MPLNRRRHRRRQPPPPHKHTPHQRMIHTKLTTLLMNPLLRRPRPPMHLTRITRIRMNQHKLPNIMQQTRNRQPIPVLITNLSSNTISSMLRSQRMQPKPLRRRIPNTRPLKKIKRTHPRSQPLHPLTTQQLHSPHHRIHTPTTHPNTISQPQHRNNQRHIRLNSSHHIRRGNVVLGDHRQQPVARLRQRRESLQRLESHRQAPAVTLVLVALGGRRGRDATSLGRNGPGRRLGLL